MSTVNIAEQGFQNYTYLKNWIAWAEVFNKEKPLSCYDCRGIPCVIRSTITQTMKDAIVQCTDIRDTHNNLEQCQQYLILLELLHIRDANNKPFFMSGPIETYPVAFHPLWYAARSGTINTISIVNPKTFTRREYGVFAAKTSTIFSDFFLNLFSNQTDLEDKNRCIHKNMKTVYDLFSKFGMHGIKQKLEAIIMFASDQSKHNLHFSVTWMHRHINENFVNYAQNDRMLMVADAVIPYVSLHINNNQPIHQELIDILTAHSILQTVKPIIAHPVIVDERAIEGLMTCVICMKNKPIISGVCGHQLCCGCSTELCHRTKDCPSCPICREPWTDLRRIYL